MAGNLGWSRLAASRKTFAFLMVAALAATIAAWGALTQPASAADTADFTLSPASGQVNPGSTIDVTVTVGASTTVSVDGAQVYLDFDPSLVEVVSLTSGGVLEIPLITTFDNTTGTLGFSAGTFGVSPPTAPFTLVTITFQGVDLANGLVTLTHGTTQARTSKATSVGADVTGVLNTATIQVGTPPPPECGFTFADNVDGGDIEAGHAIQFTDASQNASTYSWDFDDNGTIDSTEASPLFAGFDVAGPHTVTLTVTNSEGSDQCSHTVTVVAAAIASVTVDPSNTALNVDATDTFTVTAQDEFGNAITQAEIEADASSTLAWSVTDSAAGSIGTSTGLFTAGTVPGTYNGAVLATASYKGSNATDTASVIVGHGPIVSLAITPAEVTVPPESEQTFSVTGEDVHNNVIPSQDLTVVWSVDQAQSTLGTIDQAGKLTTGTAAGTFTDAVQATATYKSGQASASATVTINAGALARVDVTPVTKTLEPTGQQQFSAEGFDSNNNPVPDLIFEWTSTGGSVDTNGLFTAPEETGSYTVTATTDGRAGSATVVVEPAALHSVVVTEQAPVAEVTVEPTDPVQFQAQGFDVFNNEIPDLPFTWDTDAAPAGGAVTQQGLFTSPAVVGTYNVTATATFKDSTKSDTATITVEHGPLTRVDVTEVQAPADVNLEPTEQAQFQAAGFDASDNEIPELTFTWTTDATSSGGAVTQQGLFTAPETSGTYSVTATATFKNSTVPGSASIEVEPGPLHRVDVTEVQAPAESAESLADVIMGLTPVNTGLEPVPDQTVGTTFTVYIKLESGTNEVDGAQAYVNFNPADLQVVSLTNAGGLGIELTNLFDNTAGTLDFASGTFSTAPAGNILLAEIVFNSLQATSETCLDFESTNAARTSKATSAGTPYLIDHPSQCFAMSAIEVSVTVGPTEQVQFQAQGFDVFNNVIPNLPFTWDTDDATPAGGAVTQQGLFTAPEGVGLYDVTATATFKDSTKTGQATVEVVPGPLAHIDITGAEPLAETELQPTDPWQLSAQGFDAFNNEISELVFAWSLDQPGPDNNGSIGSESGLLIAPTIVGQYNATATATGPKQGTATGNFPFDVIPGPLAFITVSPAVLSLDAGATAAAPFTATGADAYTNAIAPLVVVWDASSSAGTITEAGLFTAGPNPGNYPGAVTATSGAITGEADVFVEFGPIASLAIDPTSVTLDPLGEFTFDFLGADGEGNEIPQNAVRAHPNFTLGDIAWSLTDPSVGTIGSDTGTFFADTLAGEYPGVITLSVTYKGATAEATASVAIVAGPIENIRVVPEFRAMDIEGTTTFAFFAEDAYGNEILADHVGPVGELADEFIVGWSTTAAGTIDPSSGLFTADTTAGTFENAIVVTGTYKDGTASNNATVTLLPGPIDGLAIFPSDITLPVGGNARFVVVGRDVFNNEISQGDIEATPGALLFTTTDDTTGNVDNQGNYSAGETPRRYSVTADATFKDGNATATATVTLTVGPLASISIDPPSPSVDVLGDEQFSATGLDRFGNPIGTVGGTSDLADVDFQATWSVIDPALGVINQDGLLQVGATAGDFAGVRVVGRSGGSEAATDTPVTVNAIAPGAPRITLEEVGDGEATFGLTPPSFTGGAAIDEFIISITDVNPSLVDNVVASQTVAAIESAATVQGLSNGTTYWAVAQAINTADLVGPDSLPTREFVPAGVPATPAAPTLVAGPGLGQITASWTGLDSNDVPIANGAAITRYDLSCTTSTGTINQQVAGSVLTRVLSGLDPDLSYSCTLTATNRVGTSASSDPSNSATPPDVPGAPEHLRGVPGSNKVDLSWVAPLDEGGSAITHYVVEGFEGGSSIGTQQTPDGETTTHAFTGLSQSSEYQFEVHAVNSLGDGQPSARTPAILVAAVPDKPSPPTAAPGDGEAIVDISGDAHDLAHNGGSPITSYLVKAQQDGSDSGQTATWTFGPLRVTVRGLDNATDYTFVVIATNAVGDSPPSDPSIAVTPQTAPDRPTLVKPPTYTQDATISLLVTTADPATRVLIKGGAADVDAAATPPTEQSIVVELNDNEPNTLEVRAENALGVQSGPAVAVVIHDTENPEAPQLGVVDDSLVRRADAEGNLTRNSTVAFEIVAERASVVTLTGGAEDVVFTATGDAQRVEASLSEGDNNFTATTVDQAGNASAVSDTVTVTLDTDAPLAPVVDPTDPLVNDRLLAITVNGETDERVLITGGARTVSGVLESPGTFSVPLDEGANELSVTLQDLAGNTSEPTTRSVEVDTIAPDAPALGDMPRVTNDLDLSALFSAEADATVTISTADNQVQLLATGNAQEESFILQANQSQQITFVATDAAGNPSSPSFHDVRHDDQAPATPVITDVIDTTTLSEPLGSLLPIPEPPLSLTTSDVAIDITVSAEAGSELAVAVTDENDDTRVTRARATGSDQNINVALSSGLNTISTTATDEAGNVSVQTDFLIESDATAPPPPSVDDLPALTNLAQITVSGNAPEADNVTIAVIGGASVPATPSGEGDFSATVTLLQNQENQIQVFSTDAAQNDSGVVEATVEHDNVANNGFEILTSFPGPIRTTTVTVEVSGLDTGDLVRFRVGPNDLNPVLIEAQSNVEATLNIPSDETTRILVNVFDPAENRSSAKSITVTNDQRPPSLVASLAAPPNNITDLATQNSSVTVWVGTDPGADITVSSTPVDSTATETFTATGAAGAVQVTVNVVEGGNNIVVQASDDAGNTADQVELFVEKDTTAPVLADITTSVGSALPEPGVESLATTALADTRAPSLTISGTTEVGAEVVGAVGETTVSTVAADGTWRLVMPLEPDSFNEISVVARDSLGNESAPEEFQITRLPNVTTIRGRLIADDLTAAFVTATEAGGAASSASVDPTDGSFIIGGLSPDGSFTVEVSGVFGSRFFNRAADGNASETSATPVNPGFNGAFVEMSVSTLPRLDGVTPFPATYDNDVSTQITLEGIALAEASELWLVSGQSTIRLPIDAEADLEVKATVNAGTSAGTYSLRVRTPAGLSLLSDGVTITIVEITPFPVVTDLSQLSVVRGTSPTITALGTDLAPATEIVITNVDTGDDVAVQPEAGGTAGSVDFTVPDTLPEGTYAPQVRTATGLGAPAATFDVAASVELTGEDQVVSDPFVPPVTADVTWTNEGEENRPGAVGVTTVLDSTNTLTDEAGNPITEPLLPPTDVPVSEESLPEGFSGTAVGLEMGLPGERVNLDHPIVVTLTMELPAGEAEPTIFLRTEIGPPPVFELAGIDGEVDGVSYARGGTVIDVVETATTKIYTLAFLTDHFSTYVATDEELASATPPTVPQNVSASAGNAQATVTWNAPVDDGWVPLTHYTVTALDGTTTATTVDTADGTTTTAVVTGLTNGTEYTFTVTATNQAELTSPASVASDPITPATVPEAPPGKPAAAIGDTESVVTWEAPAGELGDGGSNITGYTVTSNPEGIEVTVGNQTTATVPGLTNLTTYTFTVEAINAIGTGAGSVASNAVTPAPANQVADAPTNVVATASDSEATVTWDAPAFVGGSLITGYTVTSNPGGFEATTSAATLTATVVGLTNGTTYTFTVVATNDGGDSAASAASDPVIPAGPIATLTINAGSPVDAGGQQTFTVVGADASGNPITQEQILSGPAPKAEVLPLIWAIDGTAGSIDGAGVFTAGTVAGTFDDAIVATATYLGGTATDTATVVIEPSAINSVVVTPDNASLNAAGQQAFTAAGFDVNLNQIDSLVFAWSATGGSITQQGLYTAGNTPGNFEVTAEATYKSATADGTASVVITGAAPAPTPTPRPSPTPTPVFTPVPVETVQAPPGAGAAVILPNAGGEVTTEDGDITLSITPWSSDQTIQVVVEPVEILDAPEPPPGTAYARAFEIVVYDAQGNRLSGGLNEPSTVTVKYTDEDLAEVDGDPFRLKLARLDSAGNWTILPTSVNTTNKTLTATVEHFSLWGVVGGPSSALPTATATATPGAAATSTFIPPSVGDVGAPSGWLLSLLAVVGAGLLVSGGYYLRRKSAGTQAD